MHILDLCGRLKVGALHACDACAAWRGVALQQKIDRDGTTTVSVPWHFPLLSHEVNHITCNTISDTQTTADAGSICAERPLLLLLPPPRLLAPLPILSTMQL